MARRRRRPKIGRTGCLFWVFVLLVIAVIFVYRGKGSFKETIALVKKNIQGRDTQIVNVQPSAEGESAGAKIEEKGQPEQDKSMKSHLNENDSLPERNEENRTDGEKRSPPPSQIEQKSKQTIPEPEKKLKKKKRTATLYFIKIDQNSGRVKPIPVSRTIEYFDSPLTRTMNSLLEGPTHDEIKEGITSFIPEGTRLISAQLRDGYLTLNFTRDFEENYSGREAILLELSQVMLTAFDFEQVSRLKILIEGRKKEYITGEGIPLKEVYTKQDIPLPDFEG